MHHTINLIHVTIDSRHIKNIFAMIATIGKIGTKGTINGNFVLNNDLMSNKYTVSTGRLCRKVLCQAQSGRSWHKVDGHIS